MKCIYITLIGNKLIKIIKQYLKQRKCQHQHQYQMVCGFEVEFNKKDYDYCGKWTYVPYNGYYKEVKCIHCDKIIHLCPTNDKWANGSNKKYWINKATGFFMTEID